MSTYDLIRDIPVRIGTMGTERREREVSSGFTRVTTIVALEGDGHVGYGEDVTYDAGDHEGFPAPELAGPTTLGELSALLDEVDLFPQAPPTGEAFRDYRRWAFESAALDLALRQAGRSLPGVLGRTYRPVRFVVSTRLDPREWLAVDPSLEFKLDPTSDWSREHMEELAATGAVRTLDLKAYYEGTTVDQGLDVRLYRDCVQVFPEAVIEDAALVPAAREALAGAEERLSFDAPIHSLADVRALPIRIRHCNIKPSRFGSLARLLECIDACLEDGVELYGGGQFELGVGRSQIQALASLFYPDGANDVAPGGYNAPRPQPGNPRSPLPPPPDTPGFSWPS